MTRRPRRNHSPAFKAKVALRPSRSRRRWLDWPSSSTCTRTRSLNGARSSWKVPLTVHWTVPLSSSPPDRIGRPRRNRSSAARRPPPSPCCPGGARPPRSGARRHSGLRSRARGGARRSAAASPAPGDPARRSPPAADQAHPARDRASAGAARLALVLEGGLIRPQNLPDDLPRQLQLTAELLDRLALNKHAWRTLARAVSSDRRPSRSNRWRHDGRPPHRHALHNQHPQLGSR